MRILQDENISWAMCFTAGVVLGQAAREARLWLAGVTLALLLAYTHFSGKKCLKKEKFFLFCVFASGLFCGLLAEEDTGAWHWQRAERWADAVRMRIRSLPWRDTVTGELVCTLLTGDRSGLPPALKNAFRRSGASHLLALSGLHVGMICQVVDKLSGLAGNTPVQKKARSVLLILFCGLYTLSTGAGPSIVRAFFFIALRETASILERKVSPSDILAGALILQEALHPPIVRETGFQLSYLAMAGITYLYPRLQKAWPETERENGLKKGLHKVWDLCALSISCQVLTGPLAWWKFGSLPLWFLLTNLLCMPLMTVVMAGSLAALATTSEGLVALDEACCRVLIFILETIASL